MDPRMVGELEPVERFIYWIKERHLIYRTKGRGTPPPWTDDKILQNYFFTNPYREHDKVTVWVREHIREPFANHPNLWFMLCIARQINLPATLNEMIDSKVWPLKRWDSKNAGDLLDARKKRGKTVYTGAYMIRAESNRKAEWYSWTKQQYIAQIVLGRLWDNRTEITKVLKQRSLEKATKYLCLHEHVGWGPFMSYEAVSDMRWTRILSNAKDIMTWANPGPGAKRGLNRVHSRPFRARIKEEKAVLEMRALLKICRKSLPGRFPKFEMREVEHSLCEFDKYERMRLGQGRSKRRYKGYFTEPGEK